MNEETEQHASEADVHSPLSEAVVEVDIDAEPEAVWQALTTSGGMAKWMGEGSTIGEGPGDDLHINDVVTGEQKRGVLDEVTPNRRLGYTWWPETAPERVTRVAISLEPHPGGTRVTVIESRPNPLHLPAQTAPVAMAAASAATASWAWRTALLVVGIASHASVGLSTLR